MEIIRVLNNCILALYMEEEAVKEMSTDVIDYLQKVFPDFIIKCLTISKASKIKNNEFYGAKSLITNNGIGSRVKVIDAT